MITASMGKPWNISRRTTRYLFRSTLVAAYVAAGLGPVSRAVAADTPIPEPHSDSIGAAITDTVMTAKVKAGLADDGRLSNSDISVTTTNGVVTLTGSASSADARGAAEAVADRVDGVKSVDDQIHAPSPADAVAASVDHAAAATKRAVSDSWITTEVKSEILADSVSKGFEVSVETRRGVVALKGTLASQYAVDHVRNIAEGVTGVKSVDTSHLRIASN